MLKIKVEFDTDGQLPSYTWPGVYPLFYVNEYGEVLCPECATSDATDEYAGDIVAYDVNYENNYLYCDECSRYIESAYGEDDDTATEGE